MKPPKKAHLRNDETYVGPIIDESGVFFYLLFNHHTKHLYLILNEDTPPTDTLTPLDANHQILLGQRTAFAYYNDIQNRRKILIGVKGDNVLQNNWYDGPHDQMPDNYIKTGKIPHYQHYLEANYPHLKGRIDQYGYYLNSNHTARVAVGPYHVYFNLTDFSFVTTCQHTTKTKAEFYTCITQQTYNVPPDKYRALLPH